VVTAEGLLFILVLVAEPMVCGRCRTAGAPPGGPRPYVSLARMFRRYMRAIILP
jgi:hypothetical protein